MEEKKLWVELEADRIKTGLYDSKNKPVRLGDRIRILGDKHKYHSIVEVKFRDGIVGIDKENPNVEGEPSKHLPLCNYRFEIVD